MYAIYIHTDIDIHKYYIADNIIIFQICMYIYYYYILNIKYYILYYILYIVYYILKLIYFTLYLIYYM